MMNSETQSLSKGVFSFRGKKRKPLASDYVDNVCGLKAKQLQHYKYLSTELQKISQTIHSELANDLFSELITYISECGQKRSTEEIHAAAIVTGVNTPDHSVLYDNIVSRIKEEITPYAIRLQSKGSSTTMKYIMQSVASQLKLCQQIEGGPELPTSQCTLSHVEKWYSHVEHRPTSPRKGAKKSKKVSAESRSSPRPLVLIFEEFSSLPMNCVQDLLISCRNHLDKLPIVVVFGVSLSLSALRSSLSHEVSTMLSIEAFQMTSSSVYLSNVIDKMLIDSVLPFRLSGKTFQLLLDNFLCHDFSIQRFLHTIEFCVLDHCLGNDKSISSISDSDKLPKMDLDHVRRLMSFRRFVENETDPAIQIKLLEDDTYTQTRVLCLVSDIRTYHLKQSYMLRCLHSLVKDLPGAVFGKQLREVYFNVLSGGLTAKLQEAFKLLSNLSRSELESQLQITVSTMSDSPVEVDLQQITAVLHDLTHFDDLLAKAEMESASSEKLHLTGKKMDMYTLRKTLQERRPKHVTLYEEIRGRAIDALYTFYTKELVHYKDLPLHELFYYEEIKTLKSAVNALPRLTAFTALTKPHVYLEGVPEMATTQSVTENLPDTALAFKLHLECGALINVYDWMQAFISVHELRSGSARDDADLKQLCARFTHSAAEMQLLGFIKSTKKKTDHVTRLTWGLSG